jgi:hypothetical protein
VTNINALTAEIGIDPEVGTFSETTLDDGSMRVMTAMNVDLAEWRDRRRSR